MFRAGTIFGLLGLTALVGLVLWQGYAEVLRAFATAGWGIVWTNLFHVVPVGLSVWAWMILWPDHKHPSFAYLFCVMWVRCAVNNLLPVARIGGEIVSARLMIKNGWRRGPSIASVVVETTLSVVAVFVLVMNGIMLLMLHNPDTALLARIAGGVLVSLLIIVLLVVVQRAGAFGLLGRLAHMMVGNRWRDLAVHTARLDRAVLTMYRRTGRLLHSGIWMLASWYLTAVEIWLALKFLGHPMSLLDCVIMEAMIQLVSNVAFVVPGALGAQEGAFLFFGAMLGLPPDKALALGLIRRCRDLVFHLPGLVVWQIMEGKLLLNRRFQEAIRSA